MSISTLIGSRLLSGIAAFAVSASLMGGTAMASQPSETDNPVREIRHEVRDQSKAVREEIKQMRAEFGAEYAKERPDQAKLKRLHAAIEAKRDEISAMRFAALMKMHDELDPEQRAKVAERMSHEGKGKHKGKDKAKNKAKAKHKAKHAKADRPDRPDRPDRDPDAEGRERGEATRDLAKRDGKGKAKAKAKGPAPL